MLIVGDREIEAGAAAVRNRAGDNLGEQTLDQIISMLLVEVSDKS